MNTISRISCFAVLSLAFFLGALPLSASLNRVVRTGSGYGPLDTATNPYADCLTLGSPCIGYTNATFDINGVSYAGQQYSFTDGLGNVGNFDLVDVGNVASFTLPMNDISLESGVFSCGTGLDSLSQPLTGLVCTAASLANSFTISTNGNSETFNFQSTGDWVVYTVDGNLASSVVSTPEPSALLLLVVGGLGLLLVGRRWGGVA